MTVEQNCLISGSDVEVIKSSGRWYLEQQKIHTMNFDFNLLGSKGGVSACVGFLNTNAGSRYKVRIEELGSYPYSVPKVYVDGVLDNPHYYGNNRICYMRDENWNPNKLTLAFVIVKTAVYLNKYDFFKKYGYWPGSDEHR